MRTLLAFFLAFATVGGGILLTGSLPVLDAPHETPELASIAPDHVASYVTFGGTVSDPAGSPLEWAAVTVDGITALTDAEGHFGLSSVLIDASATIEANGYLPVSVPAGAGPTTITLGRAASADLTVTLNTAADLSIYDAVTFTRVASADRGRLQTSDAGYRARLKVPAGEYVAVAITDNVVETTEVAVPRRGTAVTMRITQAESGGQLTVASGAVVSAAGRPVDTSLGSAWVVAEAPDGSRSLVPLSADGQFDLNLVSGATLQAFAYDPSANTLAVSARVPVGRELALAVGARSRLPFTVATTGQQARADSCGYRGLVVMAGRTAPLIEREALQRGVATVAGDLGVVEVPLGRAILLTMFDADNGRVLSRSWSGEGYSPASLDQLVDDGLQAATQTRRPVSARLVIRTDPLGDRFLSVVDVKTGSGAPPPDGTPIELSADAGTIGGAPFARLLLAGGRTPEVRWDPPAGGLAADTDVTFSVRHSCGGTLAMRSLTQPMPGSLSFNASFAAPVSSQSCATGVAFDALLTIELARDEDGGVSVDIPITNGPRLTGSYNKTSGAITAKGDAEGVYWLIAGTVDGTRITGTLTVTVTGSDCDRTDKYAFSGDAA